MRTTLTLDDDVVAKLRAAAKNRSFRDVVNETLRAGFGALEAGARRRTPYQTPGFDLGPSLIGGLDNVEEVLSRVEGEDHR